MKLNEQKFNEAIEYLEEGIFSKFKKKKPQIQNKSIKNYKKYSEANIGEEFKGYDCEFPFTKIAPRPINSQERLDITQLVKEDYLDKEEARTYLTWKVVGIFNGGEVIALGNEKSAEYYIDFELGQAGFID